MSTYLLELGQLAPARQEVTYVRRAQAVTYTMQWQQESISEDIEALKERFNLFKPNFRKGRITKLGGTVVWEV